MSEAPLSRQHGVCILLPQLPEFTKPAVQLAYGENAAVLSEDRVAITQALSGTGALRILGAFIAKYYPGPKTVWMPNPTWGNHIPIMGHWYVLSFLAKLLVIVLQNCEEGEITDRPPMYCIVLKFS